MITKCKNILDWEFEKIVEVIKQKETVLKEIQKEKDEIFQIHMSE